VKGLLLTSFEQREFNQVVLVQSEVKSGVGVGGYKLS